jgi:DNA-binding transcriptional ArsR family regulator
MKYDLNLGDRKGFLSRVELQLDLTKVFHNLENEFMRTDYAVILLALDDEFRTLNELRRIAHPDVMKLTSDRINTFLIELEEMGLIESKREGTKHRLYRRMTRIDISNKKRRV